MPDATPEERAHKDYWRAVAKPDGHFYIIPRPELTPEFPTPEAINHLTAEQAKTMTDTLNTSLQFNVTENDENGEAFVRITPEPHLEDILEVCRRFPNEEVIQIRCQKELKWAAGKARPDIYLRYTACEAVFFATQLNALYQKPQPSFVRCTPKKLR